MNKSIISPLAVSEGERRSEYSKRRKGYNELSVPFEMRETKEAEGWTVLRENKFNIRMKSAKRFDEILENRFWNVLYRFG